MARRRRREQQSASLYQRLVDERGSGLLATYRARLGTSLPPLEEDEPIEVRGSALPGRGRPFGVRHDQRVLVFPDGRVEVVEPTGWQPRVVDDD